MTLDALHRPCRNEDDRERYRLKKKQPLLNGYSREISTDFGYAPSQEAIAQFGL